MRIAHHNTAGIVLAGGAGRRVEGLNKGLLKYQDRALIEHVVDRIKPQVAQLVISANHDIDKYQQYSKTVIRDEQESYQGPIAGILASIDSINENANITAVLVCTCDTPKLPETLFARLSAVLKKSITVSVAHDGERRQNLHCLIKREAWPSLLEFYDSGGRAIHRWYNQVQVELIEADFSDQPEAFTNINSLSELS